MMSNEFVHLIEDCNQGRLMGDLDRQLRDLLSEIERVDSGGVITVKFGITPNHDGTASVKSHVSVKRPMKQRPASEFFLHERKLHQENPNQQNMFGNVSNINKT